MRGILHPDRDREAIIQWVESRYGHAAIVTSATNPKPDDLRIVFPGYVTDEALTPVTWNAFFNVMNQNNLRFAFEDTRPDGTTSYRHAIRPATEN